MRFFLKPIFVALSHCLLFFCISSSAAAFEEERCRLLQDKACVDYSEKIIEGVATSQCWKYEQKFDCISKEQNHCSSLEANRGCNELSSNCSENSNLGLCKNLEKKFSCGKKLEERSEIKHIDTQFHVRRDEKDLSNCSKEEINQYCEIAEEVCLEPKETRNINGKSQISDRSDRGLFVLCDGMGGHEGGEIASAIAVNSISEQFRPFWIDTLPGERTLTEIISNANQAIFTKNESEQRLSLGRMGTTMVMLAIHDLDVMIAHVGDSRIYKVTNNPIRANQQKFPPSNPEYLSETAKLEQITRDHEVLNQLLDLGLDLESAKSRPDAHQLTQAMGPHPSDILDPDIKSFSLTESTLFLLCSDGLCDNDAIEQNWQTHLLPILNKQIDIQTGVDNLIELGNNVNGHDNLTAILVLCDVLIK